MKILGISSATGIVGAGIADEGGVLAECSMSGNIVRSEKLIVLVKGVLERSKLKIGDIDAVAVTTGPGSYSGLRGGLATAKALVQTLKIPIISVSTLHAIAYNLIDLEGTFCVGVNACKDDFNFSLWGSDGGKLKRLTNDITVKLDRLVKILSSVRGKLTLAADDKLRDKIKNLNILIAEPKNAVPWAVNVARIGLEKSKNKEYDDALTLVPAYSHKPNIREYQK
jgi:tRNA threonylcarbamoyladenosine biosynthesis protein TsaB